jgi:hypothetical protein
LKERKGKSAKKAFFFEKKNQKTFAMLALATLKRAKSFCFFFQKEALSCCPG